MHITVTEEFETQKHGRLLWVAAREAFENQKAVACLEGSPARSERAYEMPDKTVVEVRCLLGEEA